MAITSNLSLTVYDEASGSATTFLTYRLAIAGLSSNMSLIDTFAGWTSSSIVTLKTQVLHNVAASYVSSNYFEATVSTITSYSTNLLINLKLNADITGATTININSYGNRTLKKIDNSGNVVDLDAGDIRINHYYLFIYNGTYFVFVGSNTTDAVSISGSSVMSDTTGSVVKHNVSGITSGSYSRVIVDTFGHVTAGSIVSGSSGSRVFYSASASGGSATTLNEVVFTNGLITSWTQT